jgi:hypothetical protein
MSISTPELIAERVLPNSPIAIFNGKRCGGKGELDAVFADTYDTQQAIKINDPDYICTLKAEIGRNEILNKLYAAQLRVETEVC